MLQQLYLNTFGTKYENMWKTIPTLVELRQNIREFVEALIEPGGDDDYVTFDYILETYQKQHVEKCKGHHVNQIKGAVSEAMENKGVLRYNIVFSDGDLDGDLCMNCGNPDKEGYFKAYQGVCLRDRSKCPFNYGCGCVM